MLPEARRSSTDSCITGDIFATEFNFGTRHYLVQTAPTAGYLARHRGWQSWDVLAAGALGTGLIGGLLLLGTGHGYRFEQLAKKLRENEASLRDKEAELKSIIYRTPFMLIRLDRDLRYRFISQAYLEMTGRQPEQVVGKRLVDILGEKDFQAIRPHIEKVLQGDRVEFEREVHYPGVGTRFLHVVYTPDQDERGTVTGWIASMLDITERKRAEEEQQKLASLVEQSDSFVGMIGLDGNVIYINRAGCRLVDLDPTKASGTPIAAVLPKEWWRKLRDEIFPAVVRGEKNWIAEAQLRNMQTGRLIDVLMNIFGVRHRTTTQLLCFAAVIRDITEQKRAAEAEQILVRELQHRTNNLVAVIQGIAQRTLSGPISLDEARKTFEGRLLALAGTYRQLAKSNWSGVTLSEIVRLTLEPFTARTPIDGPDVMLDEKNAQNLSLALHELATNAMKHGALSSVGGKVSIVWAIAGDSGEPILKLRWQERGGPPVLAPNKRGFGTSLLEATFSEVNFDYARGGLTCEIHVPLGKTEIGTPRQLADADIEKRPTGPSLHGKADKQT
jgi:PAS domain S-box-containing protein